MSVLKLKDRVFNRDELKIVEQFFGGWVILECPYCGEMGCEEEDSLKHRAVLLCPNFECQKSILIKF